MLPAEWMSIKEVGMSVTRFWEEMLDGEVEGASETGASDLRLPARSQVGDVKENTVLCWRTLPPGFIFVSCGRSKVSSPRVFQISLLFFCFLTSINCWEDVGFPGTHFTVSACLSHNSNCICKCVCVFYIIYKLIYKLLGMNVFVIYKCVSKCVCVCVYCVCLCS